MKAPKTKGPKVNANPRPLRIRDVSEDSCVWCHEKGIGSEIAPSIGKIVPKE